MKRNYRILPGIALLGLFVCCASQETPPPPETPAGKTAVTPPAAAESPRAILSFDETQVLDIDHAALVFHITLENPRDEEAQIDIADWHLSLNGQEAAGGVNFAEVHWDKLRPHAEAQVFSARLDLDLAELAPPLLARSSQGDFHDYAAVLAVELRLRYRPEESVSVRSQGETLFPRIREPRLTITSITIQKADLINTRLKVALRIDNPNPFPVELRSLNYELYGGGRFWADGAETDILKTAPRSFSETNLLLVMNFINMRRELLDQVIALKQVNYRFAGEASVDTGLAFLPGFVTRFDLRGNTEVVE